MNVEIADIAWSQVYDIAYYIEAEFGEKSRDKFLDDFDHTIYLLGINPYIGSKEPALAHRSIEYHSIIVAKKNKIIYNVVHSANEEDSYVKVVAFWDCRRNPKTLVSHIEHLTFPRHNP